MQRPYPSVWIPTANALTRTTNDIMALKGSVPVFEYDMAVIGGGSGGLAASKEAIRCGAKKVVVFDYVRPSTKGTRWGLGGTCVNVGCIPKKLMHYAARFGPILHHDAAKMGWLLHGTPEHKWTQLVETVQMYVKKLNFLYRTGLRSAGVEYVNAMAKVEGPHEVSYVKDGEDSVGIVLREMLCVLHVCTGNVCAPIQKKSLSARNILIAVGGRPYLPEENEVPGAKEFCITSDDLFSWPTPPGKTLVVGASYIGLECAGFLTELGYPTTVAVRSILLRGFDRQCAEKIGTLMQEMGTRFVTGCVERLTKTSSGKIKVEFKNGAVPTEEYDTVLYAIGRKPETRGIGLEAVGVKLDAMGKVICTDEQSSVPSIFCIGDAESNGMELTPVAIRAGELLARRLFANATAKMDWSFIPTTVFTPFEYGTCGLSEEAAVKQYGEENIEVFLYEFPTLELASVHREKVPELWTNEFDREAGPNSFTKLICLKNKNMRVVGFHFIGLNSGETTQGYALALRLGATKADFDACIGIHPTDTEAFHTLSVTKASGESFTAAGGCGGGKCG